MFDRKPYEEIVRDILVQLTKGVLREGHLYEPDRVKYKLRNTPVKKVLKIEGFVSGVKRVFVEDVDYKFKDGMVEWLEGGVKPDPYTFFYVSYAWGEPSKITDTSPGSVVRTIVEAISREIDYLYAQLQYVYKSGFIDTATGPALDLVVALLGITRKPAKYATGTVVFGRRSPPRRIVVSNEAYIYDGRKTYSFKSTPIEKVEKVTGIVKGKKYTFTPEKDYTYNDTTLTWLDEGLKPDLGTTFFVDYVTYEKIVIEAGTPVSTFAYRPEEAKVYVTTEDAVLTKTEEGTWEAEVPVRALVPGRQGNTYAGSITQMPRPPPGVEYVINRKDITGGVDAESDEELRERAKKALQVAGRATLTSLETAVKGVEGVTAVVVEEIVDGVPGIVRLIVDGGDLDEIRRVVEEVKAAGIKVEIERPTPVYVDVEIEVKARTTGVEEKVRENVLKYLGSLGIGEKALYAKLISIVINTEGVEDVIKIVLNVFRLREGKVEKIEAGNVIVKPFERIVPRNINIYVKGGKE